MILAAIAAFFAAAPRLYAGATVNVAKFVTPAEMRSGSLLLKSEGDRYVEAPLVATDADVVVSGPTARGRITQIFHNPTDGWVEGIYVYPLAEGSAVDTLKMVIGERIVVADIENRKKAASSMSRRKPPARRPR
jgi:Ca-activated chloride channel family protein